MGWDTRLIKYGQPMIIVGFSRHKYIFGLMTKFEQYDLTKNSPVLARGLLDQSGQCLFL